MKAQHSRRTVQLAIWGSVFRLENTTERYLEELFETFAGTIQSRADASSPDLTVVFEEGRLCPSGVVTGPSLVRHRGGSVARKVLLDKATLDAKAVNRDISAIYSGADLAIYVALPTLFVVTPKHVVFFGDEAPPLLLSDVVENWLISKAFSRGHLMVHCAGWIADGRVRLVVGGSGAGKTTQLFTQMAKGGQFFSNDRAFVRAEGQQLLARSFPVPVNVGCGTIRALGLDLPHFDLPNDHKIRLTAKQAVERYGGDYDTWFPVKAIYCAGLEDLNGNLYWQGDDCHPFWNVVFRPKKEFEGRGEVERLIQERMRACGREPNGRIGNPC